MSEQITGQANPAGEPSQPGTFAERKRAQLEAERARKRPAEPAAKPQPRKPARPEPDAAEPTEAVELTDEDVEETESDVLDASQSDESEADPDAPGEDAEDEPDEVANLRERLQKAEERAKSMERDYRIKTHKIAAARREVEQHSETLKAVAGFYANIANQGLQPFQNLDWQSLQANPAEFQKRQRQYQKAVQWRDQMMGAASQLEENVYSMIEASKNKQAEISKEILKGSIEGWSNELYSSLREHASTELSFTPEEFDDITDWRVIDLIHRSHLASKAPRAIVKGARTKGKPPTAAQREKTQRVRDAKGKFQDAKAAFHDRPGDRGAARNFFQRKLEAERKAR